MSMKDDVTLRPLRDDDHDLRLLSKWLTNPAVQEFYPDRPDLDHIRQKYGVRTLPGSRVYPRLIEWKGNEVGYAQYYRLNTEERNAYGLIDDDTWGGFDLFIGEVDAWGHGIGTRVCAMLCGALGQLSARKIAIDTDVANVRALSLYHKMGFVSERILPQWERGRDHVLLTWEIDSMGPRTV